MSRIAAFADARVIAGAHHERLDGKGYPRGVSATATRARRRASSPTADIFDALTADRPYRGAMPVNKALAIMKEMVGTQIDAICFDALCQALKRIDVCDRGVADPQTQAIKLLLRPLKGASAYAYGEAAPALRTATMAGTHR